MPYVFTTRSTYFIWLHYRSNSLRDISLQQIFHNSLRLAPGMLSKFVQTETPMKMKLLLGAALGALGMARRFLKI
jgi:hypothetical protein